MLMIYELENPEKSPQTVIKPYEDNYSIFAVLKDAQRNVIYQSPLISNRYNLLLSQFTEKASVESVTALDQTKATTYKAGFYLFPVVHMINIGEYRLLSLTKTEPCFI